LESSKDIALLPKNVQHGAVKMGDSFIGPSYSTTNKILIDTRSDHQPFLSDRFDVHAYANSVLSGRSYRPDDEFEEGSSERKRGLVDEKDRGEVGIELAKLNYGIVRLSLSRLPISDAQV
jgi:hypothetical protein